MKNLLKNNDKVFTYNESGSLMNLLEETNNYLPVQKERISKTFNWIKLFAIYNYF